jgi:hypothetical protein
MTPLIYSSNHWRWIMDIKLNLFNTFDSKAFNNAVKFFASDKRKELVIKFQDYCANVAARCYAYGDVKHANKLAYAAELCGFGPTFRRCVVPNIPFAYNKEAKLFDGKMQNGKFNKLSELNADGYPNWEADMRHRFDTENEPKAAKDVDYGKRLASAVKAAVKHGMSAADIKKLVSEEISKSVTTVAVKKAA